MNVDMIEECIAIQEYWVKKVQRHKKMKEVKIG
jgi:hypothetical protein